MAVFKGSPLGELPRVRKVKTRRASSWDRSGGNDDRIYIPSGQSALLADIEGAGCINHIWCTFTSSEADSLRKVVLRMRWDDEPDYSVEVPIGDFFGVGHAEAVDFVSLPLQMSPAQGRAFNCFFPMPFGTRATIDVVNEMESELIFYYYIDYELHDKLDDDIGRFHAQWRRENPTDGISDEGVDNKSWSFGGTNIGGQGNYVILDAEGQGHYVGCNLNIHNLRNGDAQRWPHELGWPVRIAQLQDGSDLLFDRFNWYGEGDDMVFIDGDTWPPSMHGTGTEDYFNTAWCPAVAYHAPYHGITLPGGPNWSGKVSMYRFHIEDPICFQESLRVTIEHGHANHRSDDVSSTAYWYQLEPHKPFPTLPPVEARLPLPD